MTTMQTSRHGRESAGFSLFELIVVLMLLGLASAVLLPSFSGGLDSLQLEATGRDLVTRMKQARTSAISNQRVFRILLDPGDGSQKPAYVLANDYQEELRRFDLPDDVSFQQEPGEETMIVSFYPTGRSSGGELLLRNKRGRQIHIVVDPVTGFARVLKAQEADER